MEYLDRKWFEVIWRLNDKPLQFETDEVEAESQEEAEERIKRLYGSYDNDYQEVIIYMTRELQD